MILVETNFNVLQFALVFLCVSVCLHLCVVSIQCQNLNPLRPVSAHHPFTSTPPALRCPTPPPCLLAMASAPPQVANRRLRLPLSSRPSCPLPVLATHPGRCPHASASRSTSSYWREASHCLLEPSVLLPSPPPPPPFLLPQLPTAPDQTLPQLWANSTQVCFIHPQMSFILPYLATRMFLLNHFINAVCPSNPEPASGGWVCKDKEFLLVIFYSVNIPGCGH